MRARASASAARPSPKLGGGDGNGGGSQIPGGRALAQQPFAPGECGALRLERRSEPGQLAFTLGEARLQPAQLALAVVGSARQRRGVELLRRNAEYCRARLDVACATLELLVLSLELDATGGELALDEMHGLFPLLEPDAFGRRQLAFARALLQAAVRARKLDLELALPRAHAVGLGLELGCADGELPSSRVEQLRALERRALARREGVVGDGGSAALPFRLLAGLESSLEIGELTLARGDRVRALAERPLQLVELGARAVPLPVPTVRQLACESQQPFALEPGGGVGGRVGGRRRVVRRPPVEALLPAVHRHLSDSTQ